MFGCVADHIISILECEIVETNILYRYKSGLAGNLELLSLILLEIGNKVFKIGFLKDQIQFYIYRLENFAEGCKRNTFIVRSTLVCGSYIVRTDILAEYRQFESSAVIP